MTVDEKALSIIEKWEQGPYFGGAVQKKAALQSAIVQALKEQDRDTRHACAEAVANVPIHTITAALRDAMYHDRADLIDRDKAYAACMNVKAV